MHQARQAGDLVDERASEQPPRRHHLAVLVDVREHDLVVIGGAVAPVQDLLARQVLEDQLLVNDVGLRLGRGGGRAARGQHDEDCGEAGSSMAGRTAAASARALAASAFRALTCPLLRTSTTSQNPRARAT